MIRRAAAIVLSLVAGCAGAQSGSVWRCGADGRSYSDVPCPSAGRVVAVADARSAEQRAAAHELLARDRALARELAEQRRERHREWRELKGSGLSRIGAAAAAEPARAQAADGHARRQRAHDLKPKRSPKAARTAHARRSAQPLRRGVAAG